MVGLAVLSGLRRGELFALRWKDIDESGRRLSVRESVYDGMFGTPKTEAGVRQIPLSGAAFGLVLTWKAKAKSSDPESLVFGTRLGTPIGPNNVLRRAVSPGLRSAGIASHDMADFFGERIRRGRTRRSVPGKVTAQVMGHANVDNRRSTCTRRRLTVQCGRRLNAWGVN